MIFLQFLAPTKQNIKIGTSANQCLNTCPLIVQTNKTKYTFLVRIPESEWTSARKECNCKEASLCLDSSVWISPISAGRDDTKALNFEITWFRPKSYKKNYYFLLKTKIRRKYISSMLHSKNSTGSLEASSNFCTSIFFSLHSFWTSFSRSAILET